MQNTHDTCLRRLFSPRFLRTAGILLGFNCIEYYGIKLLNLGRSYHCLATAADAAIPFVPAFIVVYVLAYVQWAFGYLLLAQEEKPTYRRFFCALLLAKALCGAVFLLYPTCLTNRPEITGQDLLSRLTALVYAFDTPPDNLFPSMHCMESWMCMRLTLHTKRVPAWAKIACVLFTLLVFASVLLVRQHVILDIPAGIAAAEIGLVLAGLFTKERKQPQ